MCGRFTQSVSLQDVIDKYRVRSAHSNEALAEVADLDGGLRANYNLAPTEAAVAVLGDVDSRFISIAHFGHPVAFRGQPTPKLLINARAETVLSKPSFSRSAREHRAAVPANEVQILLELIRYTVMTRWDPLLGDSPSCR